MPHLSCFVSFKAGPGRHATEYDAQISKLQEAVKQRISLGKAGENDLQEVLDARLDVMVAKSARNAIG